VISLTTSDFATFFGLVVGFLGVLAAVMSFYIQRRGTKYDNEKHRVDLEMMRRSIETQMHMLTEKLVATESRWRDVNHLLLSSQSRQPEVLEAKSSVQLTPFLRSAAVTNADTIGDEKLVFVLTPFHPTYKKQFEVISQVCQNLGLTAMRGDEEFVNEVFPHILRLIVRARLVIANLDGRNPNVFYELGIAHALNKPTILIAPTPEDVPFDVRARRLVLFGSLDDLRERLRDEIARSLVKVD
jgi:hypothetical protein